jgi:two-component system, OmpR family, catabolic regulation response regulator CreB
MERILLIDDEQHILDVVEYILSENGFETVTALDGDTALALFRKALPDLVVLDLNLPGLSGLDLFREMKRRAPGIPIIMLTSRSDELDRILGLEIGADDYVTKPFSPRELAARVRAVLRRSGDRNLIGEEKIIRHGPLMIDTGSYILTYFGERILLPRQEFRLVAALALYPARVFTRENLMDRIYEGMSFVTDRSIDACVKRVRAKLKEVHPDLDPIRTVYGIGYKLNQDLLISPSEK